MKIVHNNIPIDMEKNLHMSVYNMICSEGNEIGEVVSKFLTDLVCNDKELKTWYRKHFKTK